MIVDHERNATTKKQGALTVITPIDPGGIEALGTLLTTIGDDVEGNALVPFVRMKTVHFARWVVLPSRDSEVGAGTYPAQLVLSTSYDGPLQEHLLELLRVARTGFDAIYAYCPGYPGPEPATLAHVAAYLLGHSVDASVFFVGAPGVSVERVHREAHLRESIEQFLDDEGAMNGHWLGQSASAVREAVQTRVDGDPSLELQPLGPRVRSLPWYGWVALVSISLLLSPLLIVALLSIRVQELVEARREIRPAPPEGTVAGVAPVDQPRLQRLHENIRTVTAREDHQVQNQLSHVVELKPGWIRRTVLAAVLPVLNFGATRIYNQGSLLGVSTLHFVRWALIDEGRRLMFLTNYDGSMIRYVGDFVNRSWEVPSVLTAIWSNTLRFPRSKWLAGGGARDVARFTAFLREHQVETQVWYSAYKRVTTGNKVNNDWIRRGLVGALDEEGAREWLRRF